MWRVQSPISVVIMLSWSFWKAAKFKNWRYPLVSGMMLFHAQCGSFLGL